MTTTVNPNVDVQEIAKFEQLASRWWDPDSEFKPLHDLNPLRLDYIDQRVGGLTDQRASSMSAAAAASSPRVWRCAARRCWVSTWAKRRLAVARLHQLESGATLDYQRLAAEELAEREPASFDVVTCMEMLEHVPDPASTIRACARLAKPEGHLIFSTINRNPKSYLFVVVGAEYLLRMLPKGTHDYRKFIRPSELDGWARAAGLTVRELTGLHHNPLTGRYWLGPGVSVNYMAHCRPDAAS